MFEYTSTTAPFLITGSIAVLLLLGVALRNTVPFFQKSLLPASIIAGLIGFVLINTDLIPVKQSAFETLSFHLLNLSFMSISLAVSRKSADKTAEKNEKNVRGGLWLALMWGALISVQIVVAGIISLIFNVTGFKSFHPLYGMLAAHGFAQGPVQALSMAKTWIASISGNYLDDAVQIGLFFAAAGYLSAVLIGVPVCSWFFKHNLAALPRAEADKELEKGLYGRDSDIVFGKQTTHRASLDTLTFHLALMLGTYFLTYILVSLADPAHNTMIYSMMFVWTILVANIVTAVLRKLKLDYLVDNGVQTSITNLCTDTALVACMMSISFGIVVRYLVPLFAIVTGVILVSIIMSWFLAKRTGRYCAERFIVIFGIATGTAITGLLLLRIMDPEGKTPVSKEVVWWNIFEMLTGFIAIGMAPFAAVWGYKAWLGINVIIGAVLLALTWFTGRSLAKPAGVRKTKADVVSASE